MRIGTITNLAYVATVLLTMLAGLSFILSAQSAGRERLAVEQHLALGELIDDLDIGAENRTDDIRLYVMRGAEDELAAFYVDEKDERGFEAAAARAKTLGATADEIAILNRIVTEAEALDGIERAAVADYRGGRQEQARQAVFGPAHDAAHTTLRDSVGQVQQMISERTGAELTRAKARSDLFDIIAKSMLALTALVFLGVLYFVLKRRITTPIVAMTGIINRLAKQDFDVEVPQVARRDEIGEMTAAIAVFRANGLERERLAEELRRDQRIKDFILQMMHRLQACQTQSEIAGVVTLFMPQAFPGLAGSLYMHDEAHRCLLPRGGWNAPETSPAAFPADQCWALRRGRPHLSDASDHDVVCPHLEHGHRATLCVPLTALGETVGLLHLESTALDLLEEARLYLELIAENLGLAIANLQLRERLTGMAIRDPLSGLLNRRSLDEAVNRIAKTAAAGPHACLMIDIDHFKRFNDEFGHDAGDAVIRHVADMLQAALPEGGQVFRFGGEEFTLLIEGGDETAARHLGETLCARIAAAPLSDHGRFLGTVTVSIGIAAAPGDGPVATLLARADTALLAAKAAGRNRALTVSALAAHGFPTQAAAG